MSLFENQTEYGQSTHRFKNPLSPDLLPHQLVPCKKSTFGKCTKSPSSPGTWTMQSQKMFHSNINPTILNFYLILWPGPDHFCSRINFKRGVPPFSFSEDLWWHVLVLVMIIKPKGACKKKNDIFWEFVPNGRTPPPFGKSYLQKQI